MKAPSDAIVLRLCFAAAAVVVMVGVLPLRGAAINTAAFGPGKIVESFEGITEGANATRLFPTSAHFLIPTTPRTFAALTIPKPRLMTRATMLTADFNRGE